MKIECKAVQLPNVIITLTGKEAQTLTEYLACLSKSDIADVMQFPCDNEQVEKTECLTSDIYTELSTRGYE